MRADEAHLVGSGGYRAGRHGRSGEGQDAFRSVAHGRERVDDVDAAVVARSCQADDARGQKLVQSGGGKPFDQRAADLLHGEYFHVLVADDRDDLLGIGVSVLRVERHHAHDGVSRGGLLRDGFDRLLGDAGRGQEEADMPHDLADKAENGDGGKYFPPGQRCDYENEDAEKGQPRDECCRLRDEPAVAQG